jgi:hypothetical protein
MSWEDRVMRCSVNSRSAFGCFWLIAFVVFLASGGNSAAVAADVPTLLADQPADSLVRKMLPSAESGGEPADFVSRTRRVEGASLGPAAVAAQPTSSEIPPVVLVESHARQPAGSKLASELTAAQWVFRVASEQDAGYAPLQHRDETWYESTFWQGGEQWLRVGKDWHHPGDRASSVRRFLVPADGSLTVTGRVRKAHLAGDGVRVAILHNGQRVWQHELAGDDGEGIDPNLALAVKQGDTIRFVVDKRGSIACDTTYWDPVVTYANGQKFQASVAFAEKKQGAGGWFYETPIDVPGAPGMPRLTWFDAHWALRESVLTVGNPDTTAQPLRLSPGAYARRRAGRLGHGFRLRSRDAVAIARGTDDRTGCSACV